CREVPAAIDRVVVDEAGIGRLDPAPRRGPDLAGERREGDGHGDRWGSLCRIRRGQELSELPVPAGRGSAGARKPVERDVVDHTLLRETARGRAVDERVRN